MNINITSWLYWYSLPLTRSSSRPTWMNNIHRWLRTNSWSCCDQPAAVHWMKPSTVCRCGSPKPCNLWSAFILHYLNPFVEALCGVSCPHCVLCKVPTIVSMHSTVLTYPSWQRACLQTNITMNLVPNVFEHNLSARSLVFMIRACNWAWYFGQHT